jgi:hypothetical protein
MLLNLAKEILRTDRSHNPNLDSVVALNQDGDVDLAAGILPWDKGDLPRTDC